MSTAPDRSGPEEPEWDCEAYGPGGRGFGALCFVAGDLGARACTSPQQCHEVMTGQRQRVFDRIQERAAQGDPDFVYLAGEFTSPGQLLGGPDAPPEAPEERA